MTVHVDGAARVLPAVGATVGQALQQAGIDAGPLDMVTPAPTTALHAGATITIVRVQIVSDVRSLPIPYDTLLVEDARAARTYQAVLQPGVQGLKEQHIETRLEDGREAARSIVGEQVLRPPQAEQVAVGARPDPALDAFREAALAYLGRGGVPRLSAPVIQQTLFEMARQHGDRYGSLRILTRGELPRLILQTFARTVDEATLLVFWWHGSEYQARGQVLSEGWNLRDGRENAAGAGTELGLVLVPAAEPADMAAPQYSLLRLSNQAWRKLWSSAGQAAWQSAQGNVAFADATLDRLVVGGLSAQQTGASPFVECRACPQRRYESSWRRAGDAYQLENGGLIPSPYATLWQFAAALQQGDSAAAAAVATGPHVIADAQRLGLARPDVQWTVSGLETDISFSLQSRLGLLRVILERRSGGWLVAGLDTTLAQGRILLTSVAPAGPRLVDVDSRSGAVLRTLGEGSRYVWSPDYQWLAFERGGNVYVQPAQVGAGADAGLRRMGAGSRPAWSSDSRRLAFEQPAGQGRLIVVVDMETGRSTEAATGGKPMWGPGQNRLVYVSQSAAAGSELRIQDMVSGASTLLASDGDEPLWSPDGSAVAFRTARGEVAVAAVSAGGVALLGAGRGYTWSPDGAWLAFLGGIDGGEPLLWERAGGKIRPLLARAGIESLAWSPDSQELALATGGSGELWLVERTGGNLRKLGEGRDPVWAWTARAGR